MCLSGKEEVSLWGLLQTCRPVGLEFLWSETHVDGDAILQSVTADALLDDERDTTASSQ